MTIYDVESAILTGAIVERQKDKTTSESKFLVQGKTVNGAEILTAVTKFGFADNLIIITVYVEQE